MEIVSGRDINGAVIHCMELTRELANRGHSMTLVCRPDSWIAKQNFPQNVEIIESDLSPWTSRDLKQVASVVRSGRVEIVHTHQSRAHTFGVLLRFFCSPMLVASAHNRKIQLHWCLNHHVIAVSEATAKFHRRFNLCRRKRISVIYCFVGAATNSVQSTATTIRQELGLLESHLLIGTVGCVTRRKGLIFLVEALPIILRTFPLARILSVGAPDNSGYQEAVMQRAEELGVTHAVFFAGSRRDIASILDAIDLFVLPSIEEQIPVALLEAMSSEKPVIASAVGGIPECICHETDGLLVPPATPYALADAVNSLLSDAERRNQLAKNARQKVQWKFSAEAQVARIEKLFHSLATRSSNESTDLVG